jgi:hypothetical protein
MKCYMLSISEHGQSYNFALSMLLELQRSVLSNSIWLNWNNIVTYFSGCGVH